MLLSIALNKSSHLKNLFGDVGGIDKMVEMIREGLKHQKYNESLEQAWGLLWSTTDQNATNCMRLLVGGGVQLFMQCRKQSSNSTSLLKNMLGTFSNISEISDVRPLIKKEDFMQDVMMVLDPDSHDIDIRFLAANILNNIASDNNWTIEKPSKRDVTNAIFSMIENWDTKSTLNISYNSLAPIFKIMNGSSAPECHYLPLWSLSHFIQLDPDKYCSLLWTENRMPTIDQYIASYKDKSSYQKPIKLLLRIKEKFIKWVEGKGISISPLVNMDNEVIDPVRSEKEFYNLDKRPWHPPLPFKPPKDLCLKSDIEGNWLATKSENLITCQPLDTSSDPVSVDWFETLSPTMGGSFYIYDNTIRFASGIDSKRYGVYIDTGVIQWFGSPLDPPGVISTSKGTLWIKQIDDKEVKSHQRREKNDYNSVSKREADAKANLNKLLSVVKRLPMHDTNTSSYKLNHDKESDKNCNIKTCGLELGSSNKFKMMIKEILCNGNRTNQNLENIFDDELGKKVFDRMKKGAKLNYEDQLTGKRNGLTISPQLFQYNSQIGVHDTVVPEKLVGILDVFGKTGTNKTEVKKINKFLEQLQPQIAECDTFNELTVFFCKEKGIFLHGYEPLRFLKVFVDAAEEKRKQMVKVGVSEVEGSVAVNPAVISLELFPST